MSCLPVALPLCCIATPLHFIFVSLRLQKLLTFLEDNTGKIVIGKLNFQLHSCVFTLAVSYAVNLSLIIENN